MILLFKITAWHVQLKIHRRSRFPRANLALSWRAEPRVSSIGRAAAAACPRRVSLAIATGTAGGQPCTMPTTCPARTWCPPQATWHSHTWTLGDAHWKNLWDT